MSADTLHPAPSRSRSLSRFLVPAIIVLTSLAIRVFALLHWGRGPIESEGAEYARIAENLRNGIGYVGIVTPGPELMFPPLYPLLICLASFLTHNFTLAGRLVSLVLGALLPLPALGIASRLFDRRVGVLAAVLFVVHPLLISLSITVMTEGPYMTLLLSSLYAVFIAMDSPSLRTWSMVGAAFGLSYLLRPEAVAPFLIAILMILISRSGDRLARGKFAGAAVIAFLLFASPEIAYIHRHTGKFRLEAKSAITTPLALLIVEKEAGTSASPPMRHEEAMKWASAAIDDHSTRIGIWLRPEVEVAQQSRVSLKDLIRLAAAAVPQNTPLFFQALSSRWFGAPFLPALAVLGMFCRPWIGSAGRDHLYFALVPVTAFLASFAVLWIFSRYYFVFVPFFLIWAANGISEIGLWAKATLNAARWKILRPAPAFILVTLLLVFTLVAYPAKAIRGLYEFEEGSPANQVQKTVGFWIRNQQSRRVTVMDRYTPLAFHAGAEFVYFPYCNSEAALRFLDAAKVDYIVLRRDENFTPYYTEWFAKGIPDPRAELVYASSGTDAGKVVVFRWHHPGEVISKMNPINPISLNAVSVTSAPTDGPLRIDKLNPRYFADRHGRIVLLTGSHTWGNLQDFGRFMPTPFDYPAYLNFLKANGHNFMRLWAWEQSNWALWRPYDWRIAPNAFLRSGPGKSLDGEPRFDIEKLNPEYFTRLRNRVKAARDVGIYVSVMLFNGFSIERKDQPFENPWNGHPFNSQNNLNAVDGSAPEFPDGRSIHSAPDASIVTFQEKYVAGVIDAVGDLDNVLYEISNEDHPRSLQWQSHIAEFIRRYEAAKGVHHPIGIT
jgi:4-amino-4-deoxy-L-arabinose transferase-like glycosyltransferase